MRKHVINPVKWPSRPMSAFTKKAACTFIVIVVVVQVVTGLALSAEISSAPAVILETIRGGRHRDYSSIVFQFGGMIQFEKPIVRVSEVFIRLNDVTTKLDPYREYKTFDSWVMLEKEGEGLNVRIGLPKNFLKLTYFLLRNPYRFVINLYEEKKPSTSLPEKEAYVARYVLAPYVAGASGVLDKVTKKGVESPLAKTTELKKTMVMSKPARTESIEKRPNFIVRSADNQLMSLNYINVDIREALSALAIKEEINIVMAQDVSGKVSVHLYQVTLDQALDAITRAGGFSYQEYGDLYYVYKPKEARDPQEERLKIRVFQIKYGEMDKVQEILAAIPGMRMIKIHEPSKTIIVEDTPENIQKIENIISYWDTMPKKVMIEAKILEITLIDDMSLGVNWGKILGDVNIGTGGFSTATMPTAEGISPVPGTGAGVFANIITSAGSRHQFTAALDALQSKTSINTLSTPKILAIHGKEARVQVGGQQGYEVAVVSEGVVVPDVKFIDTGTILQITPYIDDEGNILLNVKPEIKSAVIEEGIPVVRTTTVSTWLLAKSGETVFIGGLIQDAKGKTRETIPCLGSIPWLGNLFGRTSRDTEKSELVILITPTLLAAELERTDKEAIEKTKRIEQDFKKEPLLP